MVNSDKVELAEQSASGSELSDFIHTIGNMGYKGNYKGLDVGTARATRSKKFPSSKYLRRVSVTEHAKNSKHKLPGRNEPCMCGSLKKYKRCCGT